MKHSKGTTIIIILSLLLLSGCSAEQHSKPILAQGNLSMGNFLQAYDYAYTNLKHVGCVTPLDTLDNRCWVTIQNNERGELTYIIYRKG